MTRDLKVSLPAGEVAAFNIQYWRRQLKGTEKIFLTDPIIFRVPFDYRKIIMGFRKDAKRFGEGNLVLLRICFCDDINLVTARNFLLTLADQFIPVAASFSREEFAEDLGDLVVRVVKE
ncbi:hypothetical protein A3B18_00160 [Candidatus Giovannonibacteria bacterium RIFCSPLOWO2_01_FULL_46_13]|uniref:Uncharacterized protein n=1 Tax=Candidatus Giovannonibacteria bacterium RIFCSPLOWO2_01_FULL_46_13 TaxID=1798352 RepID=A0A1F5X390_9BACT|nr:MAG: hypothetical protein A3B18_00160 [Candidatus Giovannonibacteria bacterium RIFCSPLOWO2_01_FULL_46_13]